MDKRSDIGRHKAGIRPGNRCRMEDSDSLRREILLPQELANQAVVRTGVAAQMTLVGLVLRTGIAGDIGLAGALMMMKRRQKHYRQDNRQ